jgi:hypothetical protein
MFDKKKTPGMQQGGLRSGNRLKRSGTHVFWAAPKNDKDRSHPLLKPLCPYTSFYSTPLLFRLHEQPKPAVAMEMEMFNNCNVCKEDLTSSTISLGFSALVIMICTMMRIQLPAVIAS